MRIKDAVFKYNHEVREKDWNNHAVIRSINKWRAQNFVRNKIIPSPPSVQHWIVPEVNKLCDILESHLRTLEVGGRWTWINWETVRVTYNNYWAGKVQRGTELKAESEHTKNPLEKTLVKDREAPERTAIACKLAMLKFKDARAMELVAVSRGLDNVSNRRTRSRM
jgi:hypothetical protein